MTYSSSLATYKKRKDFSKKKLRNVPSVHFPIKESSRKGTRYERDGVRQYERSIATIPRIQRLINITGKKQTLKFLRLKTIRLAFKNNVTVSDNISLAQYEIRQSGRILQKCIILHCTELFPFYT